MLGSSRGGHDTSAIVDSLVEQGVNLLFVVGESRYVGDPLSAVRTLLIPSYLYES